MDCSARGVAPPQSPRTHLELADIVRKHAPQLKDVSPTRAKVLTAIARCRTAALGGHVRECEDCGQEEISYNSCRDRHCAKCQGSSEARWVEAREADLLPVEYYHVVLTVPEELNTFFLGNPRVGYGLLFRAAAKTLQEVALNPKHLGARIGVTAVLHTWTQTLRYHPHVHCIVPGGGLAPDEDRWISCRPGFFLPVRVLSKVFRGKLLSGLERGIADDEIRVESTEDAKETLKTSAPKSWVVYAKAPLAGPQQVLKYLGRYTHRIAISNHRLISMKDEKVTFRWKDRAHGGKVRFMTLEGREFLRRFLLHVVPPGFTRVRHFGLLSNGVRRDRIATCRKALGEDGSPPATERPAESWEERLLRLTGKDVTRCPSCGGTRIVVRELAPSRPRPSSRSP